ncbi:hypothetical protein [Bythopirellula polymerisocia]|uniref:PEP-CTERM protein-sorting domain-containing protein n=1 Tax=Bythopirellula polymerisocia TaxID=2528003 RepID=A0A5C6CGK6_9BACT|nr:hypothetical protein [Bythopirellula polymerisocia]TWU22684.1 hypothetical protein Pla144_41440 [Bythopirellula polymerisocia]
MWLRASAILLAFICISPSFADDLQLTLDLLNNISNDATSGGTWQLFARKLETSSGAEGDFGVAATRALLNNVDINTITFRSGIGQPTTGGPYIQTLSNGTVEINYQQDLGGPVVTGVGVFPSFRPFQDQLIASGTWPSGPRPAFGLDPDSFSSSGSFLSSASAPFAAISPDNTFSDVVTLGDFNDSDTITLLDISPHLLTQAGNEPRYHPAADFNQSGTVSSSDRAQFIAALSNRKPSPLTPAPEPSGSEAGSVFFSGDVGPAALGESGTIEIRMELNGTYDSFQNGGVDLGIHLGTPGVVRFTSAELLNTAGRWTSTSEAFDDNSVRLFAVSYLAPGMLISVPGVLFATIEYERIGPGWTPLIFEIGPETLVDGRSLLGSFDVTQNYAFLASSIGVPEPNSLLLGFGTCVLLFAKRQRYRLHP